VSTRIKITELPLPESRMSELAALLGYDDAPAQDDDTDNFAERDEAHDA
jgi:hypothetical protein